MSPFYISLEKSKFFFSGHPRVYVRGAKPYTDEAKSSPYLLTYSLTEYSICVCGSCDLSSLFPLFTGVWRFELRSTLSPERASPYPLTFRPYLLTSRGETRTFCIFYQYITDALRIPHILSPLSPYLLTFRPISSHLRGCIFPISSYLSPHIPSPKTP